MAGDPLQSFRHLVSGPEERIDLDRASLAAAEMEYPELDARRYLERIDALARAAAGRCEAESDPVRKIAALNYVLFRQEGFRGNRHDYYDPKNSFLNEVLERKTGIPITLSILYMETARRLGLRVDGVGFPGHFLVRVAGEQSELVIDPFDRGEVRAPEELETMLAGLYGKPVPLAPEVLAPVAKKKILFRMLNNLKAIYLRRGDLGRSLAVVERLIVVEPESAHEIRDRGLLYLNLNDFPRALADLEDYLSRAGGADDVEVVREHVIRLKQRLARLH